MKPENMEFQLSQLLDGQLDDQQAQALRRQMAQDPALARQFRQLQALEAKLAELAGLTPSVDWELQRESIHSKLERHTLLAPGQNALLVRLLRWSAATAAAAAVLAGLVLTLHLAWPAGKAGNIHVTYSQIAAPAAHHRPQVQTVQQAETTGRTQVRYSDAGKVPDATANRGPERGMVLISGGSDAPSAASSLDMD
jgi:anti-sigma factor RsiW